MSLEGKRVCVVGAGAIGGYLAVRLAAVGARVSVVVRGRNLEAVRSDGLCLIGEDGSESRATVAASDDMTTLGEQDIVILGMKAHQIAPVIDGIVSLIGPQTVVVTTQNGIPWWYFHGIDSPWRDRRIEAVDPGGAISSRLPVDRTIGCIVYPAAEIVRPGVIRVVEGNRFPLGEIDGSDTPRVRELSDGLRAAGLRSPVLKDIRAEIWVKLWGNLSFTPICALTHATLEEIVAVYGTRDLAAAMMAEAQSVGEKLGVAFKIPLEKRIAGAGAVGAHKTSMLQDVETGRELELAALVGSVIELGEITGVPTPVIRHVHALTALLARTLMALLATGADAAPAIEAPEARPLDYRGLRTLVETTRSALNGLGIGRGDRVAIVLPNGPAMATSFVAVAACAAACPLNPAYRAEEFEFYLSDLQARALVVEQASQSPAVAVAERLGLQVLELQPQGEAAGAFAVVPRAATAGPRPGAAAKAGPAEPDDIALILHTSGTTSRPKIVPLTQANVCASAASIRETLALTPADRELSIMPLFHIHGLIAGLLAPLSAGGAIICTPGFNALKFFSWMADFRPTWYTAVPTMHQAILGRAARSRDVIAANPLRFLRSSSSSIPPQVIAELEATFGAPLIEAYGMTEASHQMASNPLPPARRKPGTVGRAAGPEIAIMDEAGKLLGPGETGEIVIRGSSVTAGYENNPKANAEAFSDGWFRTGDQGVLDDEGYLSITGRLKEIINRGGEKISPREVDEVLMDHPAVAQVVTFAIPHDKLGEDVAACVVLRDGQQADERALREFVGSRLADFKVPRKIVFMDEIPKGATGKLQRIGLAAKLGLG